MNIEKVLLVDGWLERDAAYFTKFILDDGYPFSICSPLLEIGVYKGKYFSILVHAANIQKVPCIGVDIFTYSSESEVVKNLHDLGLDTENIQLIKEDSSNIEMGNGFCDAVTKYKFSFISVDGDHSSQGSYHDIILSSQLISDCGVIALDDFLNCRAIGVTEGISKYFINHSDLAPFAFVQNKLFVTKQKNYQYYFDLTKDFIFKNSELPAVKSYCDLKLNGDRWVIQKLFGFDIHII